MTESSDFHRQVASIVHAAAAKLELGPRWHITAADTIEQMPTMRGLRAEHDLLNTLRGRHVAKPTAVGSTWSECAGCRLPYPCPDAIALGNAA